MNSNQHKQQAHLAGALLRGISKVAPVYLTRTPKGKRLLQLPHASTMAQTMMPIREGVDNLVGAPDESASAGKSASIG